MRRRITLVAATTSVVLLAFLLPASALIARVADDGYTFEFTVVPALVVRHGFSPRAALEVAVRDYILTDDEVDHSPALNVGFRFR